MLTVHDRLKSPLSMVDFNFLIGVDGSLTFTALNHFSFSFYGFAGFNCVYVRL